MYLLVDMTAQAVYHKIRTMKTKIRRRPGFTIVELVVVITVIAVLTAITVISYVKYQQTARDSQRDAKMTVLAKSLEDYYNDNGEYPGCTAITGNPATISSSTLKSIDSSVFLSPTAPSGTVTSMTCAEITGSSDSSLFGYVGDGSAECSTGASCLEWTLEYKDESDGAIKKISSKRRASVATSGNVSLAGSATGFTSVSLSWNSVKNATSFELLRATDSTFTTNVVSTSYTPSTYNSSVTGLSYGTTYYFKMRPVASTGVGDWSNSRTIATYSLATPGITSSSSGSTSVSATWGAVSYAAAYDMQCSTDGSTWDGSCQSTVSTTSGTLSSLSQGVQYYIRVRATNGPYASSWSSASSVATTIDAPGSYTITTSSSSSNWNWLMATSNATCPAGTTPSYTWYTNGSSLWVSGTAYQSVGYKLSNWGDSVTLSVATTCVNGSISSSSKAASNAVSKTLTPASITVSLPGDSVMYWSGSCPAYTTSFYYHYDTNGRINASGDTTATSYTPSTWWGDGRAYATIYCSGPWGTTSATANSMYGPGCVPTPTVSACYE